MSSRSDSTDLSFTRSEEAPPQPVHRLAVPCLTILYHPEVARVGERASLPALLSGGNERLSRREPEFASHRSSRPRDLDSPFLSRQPIILTGNSDNGITLEPWDAANSIRIDGQGLEGPRTLTVAELESGVVITLARRIVLLLHLLKPVVAPASGDFGLVGDSGALQHVRQQIHLAAKHAVPVLVRGETGVGKELVARGIHRTCERRNGPFVAVNLAAIPPTLAVAELFGAERGAFTGLNQPRRGNFRTAHRGTLFLDEIGDIPVELQAMFLRVLEDSTVQPLGSDSSYSVDVRIVAATDQDLEAAVSQGSFRIQLLHRLSAYVIHIPPLRARREDIALLFFHFLRRELESTDGLVSRLERPEKLLAWIPPELIERLVAAPWPGNVRQLQNVVRHLAISHRDGTPMTLAELELELTAPASATTAPATKAPASAATTPPAPRDTPTKSRRNAQEIGREELVATLEATSGNIARAAQRLAISRTSLYRLMKRHGLRPASELSRDELTAAFERFGGDLGAIADSFLVSRRSLYLRLGQLGLR